MKPNPQRHPDPTLFSPAQRTTLRAIVNTILAPHPLADAAPDKHDGDTTTSPNTPLADLARAKVAAAPHLRDAGVTPHDVERFLRTAGGDLLPHLVRDVESSLERNAPSEHVAFEVGLLLSAMGSTLGMLALTGSPSLAGPFATLPRDARERALAGFATSALAPKRKAFAALKQLICVKAFGPGPRNPLWSAVGYAGPRPSREVMRDAEAQGRPERDYTPYLLDLAPYKVKAKTEATATAPSSSTPDRYVIPAGAFDAVVVGSGCGGSVVAARLAAQGRRVLVLDKGLYLPRAALTGTEEEFDRLYERGGTAVTEDTSLVVLAGATLGGGSTVNWACSLEPPEYLRREWAAPPHGLAHFVSPAFQRSVDRVTNRLGVVGGKYGTRGGLPLKQNRGNRILLEGCRRIGVSVKVAPNNMVQPGNDPDADMYSDPYVDVFVCILSAPMVLVRLLLLDYFGCFFVPDTLPCSFPASRSPQLRARDGRGRCGRPRRA